MALPSAAIINYPTTSDITLRRRLRRLMRYRRKQLSLQQQWQATHLICQRVAALPQIQTAEHIALYAAFDGEINIYPLCKQWWQQGKKLYLPQIHPQQPGHLLFAPYTAQHKLQPNQYGILEPLLPSQQAYPLQKIAVLLLPVVAFDANCHRLGMGGGYYDRTLHTYLQNTPSFSTLFTVGLAHECQQVDSFPIAIWDQPLQVIATPQQLFLSNRHPPLK